MRKRYLCTILISLFVINSGYGAPPGPGQLIVDPSIWLPIPWPWDWNWKWLRPPMGPYPIAPGTPRKRGGISV